MRLLLHLSLQATVELNLVELQNGCMAITHVNLLIPSTLAGFNIDSETGKLHKERFTLNMKMTTVVYINWVNHCSTIINLFRGADSTDCQKLQVLVLCFLKDSKQAKANVEKNHPEQFLNINMVWSIRNRHLARKDLPLQYVFFLYCCYEPDCPHPRCQAGGPTNVPTWYEGGPPLSYIPVPIQNPKSPWGSEECPSCEGV